MRVTYVTMQFPAPSETFACSDVAALRRLGVDVRVLGMRPAHTDHNRMVAERGLRGIPIRPMSPAHYATGVLLSFRHPGRTWTLLRWALRWHWRRPSVLLRCLALLPSAQAVFASLRTQEPEIVHLFWGHFPSMVGLLLMRYSPQTPVSVFLGAYDLDEGRYGRFLEGSVPVAHAADVVWTHARANLRRLHELGVRTDRLQCVYRGVDVAAFGGNEVSAERPAATIVTVASLIERKGVDDAVRVLVELRRRLPEATLTVVGDGPERDRLVALARQLGVERAVRFTGHLSSAEVSLELRRAAAFVLMSKDDRIPNVVKEAMLSGCSCVVTHTQGMEELVLEGTTGYLVPVGDVAGAAERLFRLLDDDTNRKTMVAEARRHVELHFSADASMRTYVDGWKDVLVRRDGGWTCAAS